ncbi:invasin domain 3-containing protein [Paenibacillus paeoniae]|uniref:Intimin n=1 Tax=Paenibacillus paeoniae TaxID=2292705 RepID=A0A371PNH3_9BACL|nr:invasin domain 3-containing protein [Paenibacillus paeoniae]REK77741.1 hypothetical protein DX130_12340 [Paenibacillus paeoniae]
MKKYVSCLLLLFLVWSSSVPQLVPLAAAHGNALQPPLEVQAIAAGGSAMLVLMSDGTVRSWGRNTAGQLGVGSTGNRNYASIVENDRGQPLEGIVAISLGSQHGLALSNDGIVYSWGTNNMGQLGRSGRANLAVAIDGFDQKKITQISAGDSHSLVLDEEGQVWGWGLNMYGEVGNGSGQFTINRPVKVMAVPGVELQGIQAVAAGQYHSVALTDAGSVIGWGMNTNGQLGDGTQSSRSYPVSVRDTNGQDHLSEIKQISANGYTSIALKTDGTLRAWGDNSTRQLGTGNNQFSTRAVVVMDRNGEPIDNVSSVHAGWSHVVAIKSDGSLWSWGSNVDHQLGYSTEETSIGLAGQVMDADNTPLNDVIAAVGGSYHTSILRTDGSIWSVGKNRDMVLGGNRPEGAQESIQRFTRITLSARNLSNWTANSPRSAAAGETVEVSFQLADNKGKALPVGTDDVRFAAVSGTLSDPVYDDGGVFTAAFRPEQAGTVEISAIVNGVAAGSKLTMQIIPGVPDAEMSVLRAVPERVAANETSGTILELVLVDAWGNTIDVDASSITFSTTRGTVGPVIKVEPGKYEAPLYSPEAGSAVANVELDGERLSGFETEVFFFSGSPDAARSTLNATPERLTADGKQKAVVQLQVYDQLGNALTQSGGAVTFTTSLGQIGTVTEVNHGVYTAELSSTIPGLATVKAMLDEQQLGNAVEVEFVRRPNPGTGSGPVTEPETDTETDPETDPGSKPPEEQGEQPEEEAEQSLQLTDISGHWAQGAITRAVKEGIVSGYPDHSFQPQKQVTRAEFVVMLSKVLKLSGKAGQQPLESEKWPVWASEAIGQMLEQGIIQGYPDGMFHPQRHLTRVEMVAIISRALHLKQAEPAKATTYGDDSAIPTWAKPMIAAAEEQGLIKGRAGNQFAPDETTTRAEAVVLILRVKDWMLAKE